MLKLSFSSLGNPDMPVEKFAELLGVSGYDGIALRGRPGKHVHWEDSPARRREVKTILGDAGLEVSAITTYLFLANRDSGGAERPDHRSEEENRDEILRWMDLAGDLEAGSLRVFGGALTEGETHEDAAPRVARLIDAAASANPDVNVAIELHDVWGESALVARMLDMTSRPNCGVVWDIHAPVRHGESPQQVIDSLGVDRIAYVQVKDRFPLPDGKPYHCLLGAGDTPIKEMLGALKQADWSGYVDVEYEACYNDYMPGVEVGIPQSIMKLRQYLAELP